MKITYKDSGVDVDSGDALVEWLQDTAEKPPHHNRILEGIGGFASLFRGDFPEMKKPILVSSTDGVGTKLKIAIDFDRPDAIAQDLVAMCVNDLVTTGAQPLFFLDYYATGKLNLESAKRFLAALRLACNEAQCALVGGETAEMPGIYQGSDFDCAGFSVGVVDEPKILGRDRVAIGDLALGISSSGFHSNGYSLLRKLFESDMRDWANTLLTPTHIYVKFVHSLPLEYVKSIAHITGGGVQNIPRVLPKDVSLHLEPWAWPEPFQEVQRRSKMSRKEMLETLNCGVGLVVIVEPKAAAQVRTAATQFGYSVFDLGEVKPFQGEVLTYA